MLIRFDNENGRKFYKSRDLTSMSSLELTLILPKKLERKLKEECERSGASIEELALEALCRGMDEEIDPSDRAELYARLSEKYLREAEDLLSKDHIQASEKLWGAAALMVKAVATTRDSISSHELFSFVRRLGEKRNPELRRLFSVASTLYHSMRTGCVGM